MIRYAVSRLISLGLSLVAASVVIFSVVEVIPGDPAAFMLGLNASDETVAALRAELGLSSTPVERYFGWVGGLLVGDFGTSYTYRVPVSELVLARLGVSLPLAAYALVLSTVLALPVGMLAAARRGKAVELWDHGGNPAGHCCAQFSGSPCCWSCCWPSPIRFSPPAALPVGTPASGRA